jgi:hypothetical protein
MIFAAVYAHGVTPFLAARENGTFSFPVLFYLVVFAVIMLLGFIFRKSGSKKAAVEIEKDAE